MVWCTGRSSPATGRRCWTWGTPWFSPCRGREREAVARRGSVAQCFGNCNHSFPGVWIQDTVNPPAPEPHLSLQCCEKVQLQPSAPSYCILLSVSIWLLRPMQHQHGWSKMSYLGWGSWLSTAQIEDQMQTFTLGFCHLKYTWVELILFQRKWKLSGFFLHVLRIVSFCLLRLGLLRLLSRTYLGRLNCEVPPALSNPVPCSCRQSHLIIPFINWSSAV